MGALKTTARVTVAIGAGALAAAALREYAENGDPAVLAIGAVAAAATYAAVKSEAQDLGCPRRNS